MGRRRTRIQVRTAPHKAFDSGTHSLTRLYVCYYRPERWLKDIPGGNIVPGVWGNTLSFIGGARACIGYRFALVEYVRFLERVLSSDILPSLIRMKALLFQLIRSLEFELNAPVEDIARKSVYVSRHHPSHFCSSRIADPFNPL